MSRFIPKNKDCPNCEQPLAGANFCPSCGQKNDARRITFWQLVTESLSNFLAFDGRFLLTFKNLLIKPGLVPKHYKQGKRMRYMHPVRFYFLCSLVMLFFLNTSNRKTEMIEVGSKEPTKESKDTTNTADVFFKPNNEKPNEAPLNLKLGKENDESWYADLPSEVEEDLSQKGFSAKLWGLRLYNAANPTLSDSVALENLNLEASIWNKYLYKQMEKSNRISQEEYNRFFNKNFFWVLFFFVPILGFILKLFFWRQAYYYPEHLFFAFYSQSILFLLFTLGFVLNLSQVWFIVFAFLYAIYLLLSMYRFYEQRKRVVSVKFIFINLTVILSFFVFIMASILITYLLY